MLNDFILENPIFQIRWVENEGPYRKLIPLLKEKWDEDCVIITIDDDTFYDNKLIENYLNDYEKYNCCISYRGFTFKMEDIFFNAFRPGMSVYGVNVLEKKDIFYKKAEKLKCAMDIYTTVINSFSVESGESISYNGAYKFDKKSNVVVIPF